MVLSLLLRFPFLILLRLRPLLLIRNMRPLVASSASCPSLFCPLRETAESRWTSKAESKSPRRWIEVLYGLALAGPQRRPFFKLAKRPHLANGADFPVWLSRSCRDLAVAAAARSVASRRTSAARDARRDGHEPSKPRLSQQGLQRDRAALQ